MNKDMCYIPYCSAIYCDYYISKLLFICLYIKYLFYNKDPTKSSNCRDKENDNKKKDVTK